jgi:UDP-N-acetyl-D-glucosamine dehydrogenase
LNTNLKNLIERLTNKSATIAVIGLGYVGLPIVIRYTEIGFRVLGIDIDQAKVDKLNASVSYIEHIADSAIAQAVANRFVASADFSRVNDADAVIICVPTPLNRHREPDLDFVIQTTESLLPHLRKGQVISLESTTYPGTTEEELLPRIESTGHRVGKDIFLVYSPEREDPGNPSFVTQTIPKVCGGYSENCLQAGLALYSLAVDQVVPVSSLKVAEMTKLLENIHRAVNIGLVNEMKIVSDKMGINIHEVIDAAKTKPFGFTPYYPGPGLGGHCIPIDPFYLTWKARQYDINTRFIELAGEVNTAMPAWVIDKLTDALNDLEKSVKGAQIMILGIAYKKNVDDTRESPSVILMEMLRSKGAILSYSDPHIPTFPAKRNHSFDLSHTELHAQNIGNYDAVLLVTDHDKFDYELIKKHARLIIDTRGRYSKEKLTKIVHA